jgi:hypothetical protein
MELAPEKTDQWKGKQTQGIHKSPMGNRNPIMPQIPTGRDI